jgi:hypothetical protein
MKEKKERVEITATIKHWAENGKAVLIKDHESGKTKWLPLSQIAVVDPESGLTVAPSRDSEGDDVTISMPEWLAIKEELV